MINRKTKEKEYCTKCGSRIDDADWLSNNGICGACILRKRNEKFNSEDRDDNNLPNKNK